MFTIKKLVSCFACIATIGIAAADTEMTYSGVLPTTQTVLFQNANLLAVKGLSLDGYQKFGGLNTTNLYTVYKNEDPDKPASGYYTHSSLFGYVNNGSTLTVEFHGICRYGSYNGIGNGFELKLTQSGNDILGEVTWMAGFTGANDYENSSWVSKKKSNFNDWDSTSATYSTGGYNLTLFFRETESHTVTFVDWDGTKLKTQTVDFGADATPPANPSRANYVFVGWDTNYTGVTEDLTVTALYHAFYTVTFLDANGTTLDTQQVEETTAATAPDMTGRTYGGNPFSGWDADFSSISSDLTVTAQYVALPAHIVAAIAAGDLPSGALIWCGDDAKAWDDNSLNWYTTAGQTAIWSDNAVAVFATSGVVRVSGPKNVGGIIVALDADVALTGDAITLASGAETIFNSDGSLSVSNDVVCTDSFVQRVRDAHDVFVPGQAYNDEIEGNLTSESQLLFSNVSLADVEYIQGKMTGNFGSATKTLTLSTASAATSDGGVFYFSNDGATLTAQFQIKSYSTGRNCIKVQLVQVGNDIYGQIAYEKSGYTNDKNNPPPALGTNWDDYTGNGYSQSICDLVVGVPDKTIYDKLPTATAFKVAGDLSLVGPLVVSNGVFEVVDDGTLCGGNFTKSIVTWNDGTVLFGSSANQTLVTDIQTKGTGAVKLLQGSTLSLKEPSSDHSYNLLIAGDASATGYKTLPANSGSTTVLPGGSLALDRFTSYWGPMAGAPLIVQTNGLLRLLNENSIGVSKPIYLEGGTLSNEVDKANILYKLYMNDGARVTGKGFQVGFKSYYNSWSFINVGGSLPSLIDAESLMVGFQCPAENGNPIGVKFIVADVTDSDATDLLVASPITERTGVTLFTEGYRDNLGVWKQGLGTLELTSPANDCTTGVFKVEAGTVRLGAGCGGGFGALIVLGDATIDCAGGAIAFEDSADMAWTEGATLSITGNMGKRTIRVGTDNNSLTAGQLAAIKYVNAAGKAKSVSLTEDGYLVPPSRGTSCVIR
ncbi:MAG: InlB B-repeat-containing protein [Kiritimatiellae bacterium]|nr:InlB B-repeat-containing protein [Kiritimatiellia bacterium]